MLRVKGALQTVTDKEIKETVEWVCPSQNSGEFNQDPKHNKTYKEWFQATLQEHRRKIGDAIAR